MKEDMDSKNKEAMPLTLKGTAILAAGLLLMVLGYVLMTGGGSDDPQVFNEAMFNARRLVVAPLVIAAGVVVEIIAIMGWFPSKRKKN